MPGFFRPFAQAVAIATLSVSAAHAADPHFVTATSDLGSITVNDVLSGGPGGPFPEPRSLTWAISNVLNAGAGYVNTQATTVDGALRIAAPGNIPDPIFFREPRATVGMTRPESFGRNDTYTRLDIDVPLLTQFAQPGSTGLAINLVGSAFYHGTPVDEGVRARLQLNALNGAGQSVSLVDASVDTFANKASPFLFNVDALVPAGFDVKRLTGRLTAVVFLRPGAPMPPIIASKAPYEALATLDSMTIRAVTTNVPEAGSGSMAAMGLGLMALAGLRARRRHA